MACTCGNDCPWCGIHEVTDSLLADHVAACGSASAGGCMKVCAEPGCPTLTKATRCTTHTRAKDKARGTRQQRGYGATHRKLRREFQRRMDDGMDYTCWRCGAPIDITAWDLGHDDLDRSRYLGPECIPCNRGTSTRR